MSGREELGLWWQPVKLSVNGVCNAHTAGSTKLAEEVAGCFVPALAGQTLIFDASAATPSDPDQAQPDRLLSSNAQLYGRPKGCQMQFLCTSMQGLSPAAAVSWGRTCRALIKMAFWERQTEKSSEHKNVKLSL